MCASYSTEYERKFVYSAGTELKLSKLGARIVEQQVLEDVYYDTVDYHFALNDHWLRNRNRNWELKFRPFSFSSSNAEQLDENLENIAKYREITNENDIKQVLSSLLYSINDTDLAKKVLDIDLNKMVATHFKILAQFQSNRKKYSIENLTIDLDETNFGFGVGEIEYVVDGDGDGTDGETMNTTKRINNMAAILGVPNQRIYGKLETYLKMNNPELLQKLILRGLFKNL